MGHPLRFSLAAALALALPACGAAPEPGPERAGHAGPAAASATGARTRGATSSSDPALRARLQRAFGGYEATPDRRSLERLAGAERLVPALAELADDAGEPPHKRANALASLRFFADAPRARAELAARANDAATPPMLRRSAARALAAAYGDDALDALAPLLGGPDADLRETVVRAVGATGTPRARALLEQHASLEADPNVRLSLRRALTSPR